MSNSVSMKCPSGITSVYSSTTQQTYTANANGFIVVDPRDVSNLLNDGFSLRSFASNQYSTDAATADKTAPVAEVCGGDNTVLNMTGNLGAGHALTLPLVTDLVAAIPGAVAGQSYRLRLINSSAGNFAWTVTTNTGWTLTGTMTVAQNTWRDFIVTLTSLTTATLQAVGTGTQS